METNNCTCILQCSNCLTHERTPETMNIMYVGGGVGVTHLNVVLNVLHIAIL